jgi:hypothetical protein
VEPAVAVGDPLFVEASGMEEARTVEGGDQLPGAVDGAPPTSL